MKIFLITKYTRWYNNIILNAQARTDSTGYMEKHHIIPRSLGGLDNKDNLVKLTAREHFICHWLLTKMTVSKAKSKMIFALNGMKRITTGQKRYSSAITSKVYDRIKPSVAKMSSDLQKGRKGEIVSDETRRKLSALQSGANNSFYGKTHSAETKAAISKSGIGRNKGKILGPQSAEFIEKRISKIRGVKKKIVKCPHCEQSGGISQMKRWHFDNCKQLITGVL